MAFFQRVVSYLVNEVLVNTLANSRTFQKFAVRSEATINDIAKKAAEGRATASERGSAVFQAFRQELTKGLGAAGEQPPRRPS